MSHVKHLSLAMASALLAVSSASAIAESDAKHGGVAVSAIGIGDVTSLSDLSSGAISGLQVQVANDNANALDLTLRGFGGTTAAQASGEAGVGVYVDGVYQSRAQGLGMDLIDLDTIEVLRGPQGVLSGRNTIGGAVKLVSKKPSGELGFTQRFTLGSEFDEFKSISHLDLPKLGVLSAKLSYLVNDHDGWVENQAGVSGPAGTGFWSKGNDGLRAALNFDLSDSLVVDYVYQDASGESTQPYFFSVVPGSSGFAVEEPGDGVTRGEIDIPATETENESHALTAAWQINDTMSLQSVSSYRELDTVQFTNFDDILGAGVGTTGANGDEQNQEQTTQEFILNGSMLESALSYTVGLAYFDEEVELSGDLNNGSAETESFAVYAQGTYALDENLSVTLGWRETSEEKTVISDSLGGAVSGFQTEIEDDNTDIHARVDLAFADNLSTYLSYASAFKSGGASILADGLQPYEAESVETLEVGVKAKLWDQRANISVVAFYADYKDQQVAFVDPDNVLQSYVINASEDTSHEGAEIDISILLDKALTLTASYNYLDADNLNELAPYADDGMGGTEFSLGGGAATTLYATRAPEHSGTIALDYQVGSFDFGTVSAKVAYSGSSLQYFNSEGAQANSRDVINASLTFGDIKLEGDSGELQIALWGKNLNDEAYVTNSIPVASTSSVAQAFGEPRTYGLDFVYKY